MIDKDTEVRFTEEDPDPLLIGILKARARKNGRVTVIPLARQRGIRGRSQQISGQQSELNRAWADYLKKTGLG